MKSSRGQGGALGINKRKLEEGREKGHVQKREVQGKGIVIIANRLGAPGRRKAKKRLRAETAGGQREAISHHGAPVRAKLLRKEKKKPTEADGKLVRWSTKREVCSEMCQEEFPLPGGRGEEKAELMRKKGRKKFSGRVSAEKVCLNSQQKEGKE